jgi:exodeoxyribonuclease VII small subunit
MKELSFEQKISKIEEIVELLDSGDESMDNLLMRFEEGLKLVKECREFLDKAEMKIIDITKEDN